MQHNFTVSHFPTECQCGISEILNILEFGGGGGAGGEGGGGVGEAVGGGG